MQRTLQTYNKWRSRTNPMNVRQVDSLMKWSTAHSQTPTTRSTASCSLSRRSWWSTKHLSIWKPRQTWTHRSADQASPLRRFRRSNRKSRVSCSTSQKTWTISRDKCEITSAKTCAEPWNRRLPNGRSRKTIRTKSCNAGAYNRRTCGSRLSGTTATISISSSSAHADSTSINLLHSLFLTQTQISQPCNFHH